MRILNYQPKTLNLKFTILNSKSCTRTFEISIQRIPHKQVLFNDLASDFPHNNYECFTGRRAFKRS